MGFLINFIVYTNLATTDEDGTITRGNFDEITAKPEMPSGPDSTVKTSPPVMAEVKMPGGGNEGRKSASVVVHFHVHDFAQLTPENADALRKWVKLVNQEGLSVRFDFFAGGKAANKP